MQCVFPGPQARRLSLASLWLSLLPLGTLAQAVAPGAEAADPTAFVPPAAYRSVFADTPTGVESAAVPWRKANDDVGQFQRGHMDVIKWEAKNPGLSAPPVEAAPVVPAAATHTVLPMAGHMHHGGAKQ